MAMERYENYLIYSFETEFVVCSSNDCISRIQSTAITKKSWNIDSPNRRSVVKSRWIRASNPDEKVDVPGLVESTEKQIVSLRYGKGSSLGSK